MKQQHKKQSRHEAKQEINATYLIFTARGSIRGCQGTYRGTGAADRGVDVSRHCLWCDGGKVQFAVLLVVHHILKHKPTTQ